MSEKQFSGFPRNFLMLLAENSFNDSKVYYETVKEQIKQSATVPMRNLCADLSGQLFDMDEHMNLIPSRMVSRVRRDTRVAKNENMYRNNMWAMFMRDKYAYGYFPCMWFEVQPGGWSCGVGIFNSDPTFMGCYRETILQYPKEFERAVKSVLKSGAETDLEQYKKPKPGSENIEKRMLPYFNAKSLFFIYYSTDLEPLFDGSIENILSEKFRAFRPMYKFIASVSDKLTEKGLNTPRRMR